MRKIGMVGTFDVQNFGDLLFTVVAEKELERRLGPLELQRFSYHQKGPPDWPFAVASVTTLPNRVAELDGMLIGGGHIIRFDKCIAPGYFPPNEDIHHPTGYWLMPALFALQYGCPVAWNCPSASLEIPSWSEPLMRAALQNSDYVAVRDEASRNTLLRFTDDVVKVPDTCFGISRWIDQKSPSADYLQMRQAIGLTKPYIVIQSSHRAKGFCDFIRSNREQFADYQFLSLPIGPALGDAHFVIADHFGGLVSLASWPDPMLLGELIAGATAVVGDSLHLAVAALSFKIPVFRPGHAFDGKFAILKHYANLHVFEENGDIDPAWFKQNLDRREACPALQDSLQQLDLHWDRVAQCFTAGSNRERATDIFVSFAQRLPGLLENEARLAEELMQSRVSLEVAHRTAGERGHAIELRDATISGQEAIIANLTEVVLGKDGELAAAGLAIADRDGEIVARNVAISNYEASLAELTAAVEQKDIDLASAMAASTRQDDRILAQEATISELTDAVRQKQDALARSQNEILICNANISAREATIGNLTAEIQHKESELSAALSRSEALEKQAEQLDSDIKTGRIRVWELNALAEARASEIRGLRGSTSWRITKGLRAFRNLTGSRSRVLRLKALEGTPMNRTPYDWAFANQLFSAKDSRSLVATYPCDHFKTVKGYDGEKGYEYEARAIIQLGSSVTPFFNDLSEVWRRFVRDLLSPDYRAGLSRLTGLDLASVPMEAYVCHFGPGAWLGPHLDLKTKILTHVFYFNESWQPADGGCLNILQSSNMSDSIAEISPVVGNSSVLVRSNNSWHSVSKVVDGCRTSRRSMNVIFYHPGAVSTMWPPGDMTPLHRYDVS